MSARKYYVAIALGAVSLLLLASCAPPPQTCNKYGCSDAATATTKIASGDFANLNAADVQVVVNLAAQASGTTVPFTEDQANAIVVFLHDNNIGTKEDLTAFIAQAEADPNSVVISDTVRAQFEALSATDYAGLLQNLGQQQP